MEFNSPIFLFLFLPVFILIYYVVGHRVKLVSAVFGSLLFYAWGNLTYIPGLLGLLLLTYVNARRIERWKGHPLSLVLVCTGVLSSLGLLIAFKLWTDVKPPLGISYLIFQVIAYYVEVHQNKVQAEADLLDFSFYLLLFPKIPVGPITRYSQLRDQIKELHLEPLEMAEGMRRFIIGFAKKALIADTLAKVVTPIFNLSTPTISTTTAWLVIVSYSLQLYFDFSGYTDMAIGLGRMMGLRFIENFNYPYISKSIGEFWRRWHISLSSWFRDFVFYPLERQRLPWLGQPINILIVFLLTGLWHGFTANFILWGLIHGSALVFEGTWLGRRLRTAWVPVQHVYALGVILIGWVFFRSPTPHFARVFLGRLLGNTQGLRPLPFDETSPWPFVEPTFLLALALGILFALPVGQWMKRFIDNIPARREGLRFTFQLLNDLILALILIVAIAATSSSRFAPGIYGAF